MCGVVVVQCREVRERLKIDHSRIGKRVQERSDSEPGGSQMLSSQSGRTDGRTGHGSAGQKGRDSRAVARNRHNCSVSRQDLYSANLYPAIAIILDNEHTQRKSTTTALTITF
ncbi:hypothetical protein RB195_025728 [Necator americanus]|uniref:Uncharacterized protein n=1 Tax=Necator americanus TaxID=51031 RepID=A0ABR1ETM5_NECAM